MTSVLASLLAVMMMTEPDDMIDAEAAAALRESGRWAATDVKEAHVSSRSSDFDRSEGVVLYEGNVRVSYSEDYSMCSDRLYMFLAGSNDLSRVVAVGNVAITNKTRVGLCAMAVYRRKRNEVEMYGDGKGVLARLLETGEKGAELEGSRIRFWLDSEQVEVENSKVSVEREGGSFL